MTSRHTGNLCSVVVQCVFVITFVFLYSIDEAINVLYR